MCFSTIIFVHLCMDIKVKINLVAWSDKNVFKNTCPWRDLNPGHLELVLFQKVSFLSLLYRVAFFMELNTKHRLARLQQQCLINVLTSVLVRTAAERLDKMTLACRHMVQTACSNQNEFLRTIQTYLEA